MKTLLKELIEPMRQILASGDHWQKIEAARVLCALEGVYVGSAITLRNPDPAARAYKLRDAQEVLAGKVWQRKSSKQKANRRYYLKQRIMELETDGSDPERLAELRKELFALNGGPRTRHSSPEPQPEPVNTVSEEDLSAAVASARAYLESVESSEEKEVEDYAATIPE